MHAYRELIAHWFFRLAPSTFVQKIHSGFGKKGDDGRSGSLSETITVDFDRSPLNTHPGLNERFRRHQPGGQLDSEEVRQPDADTIQSMGR